MLGAALLALFPAPRADAAGASRPLYGARPAWVEPLPPAAPSDGDDLRGGVEFLVVDDQVRVTEAEAEHWVRRIVRITSPQGVDSESQIQLDWDPAYESLTIHRIVVRRGGREIDRLEPSAIEIVRREPAFEASLLDGTLSALVLIPDVRVGDVIEHEYSVRGSNPVFAGHWFGGFTVSWGVAVRELGFRLMWPEGRTMHWQDRGTDAAPALRTEGGEREARWHFENPPVVEPEGDEPPWFDPGGGIAIGEFSTWGEVARWAAPLYDAPEPSGEVRELVERLGASGSKEDQALAAIRFVQDDVRYLGLEIGTGSHRPSSPAVVLDRRFGDCKDKALLLVTLLRGLGIAADCALVSTTWGDELLHRLPSPGEFDHVVVRLVLDGRTSWIDATIPAQRGRLDSRHVPRLGRALVVRPDTEALDVVTPPPGDAPRTEVDARFVLPSVGGAASLNMRTTYFGRDADSVRESLSGESREQTERSYREYYARLYPGLQSARPLVIRDDEDHDILVTEESYRLPQAWLPSEDGATWTAQFRVPEIESLLGEPELAERKSPLAIDHPQHVRHLCSIELPEPWNVEDSTTDAESEGARFHQSVREEGSRIEIETEWTTLADWIPAGDAPRHVSLIRQALDLTTFELNATAAGRPIQVAPGAAGMGLNWSILATALLAALWGVAGGLVLVFRRSTAPPGDPGDPDARPRTALVLPLGLGAAIALPLGLGFSLARSLAPFELPAWIGLTMPGRATYDAAAAPLMLASLVAGIVLFTVSVALVPMLFLRRRAFPVALSVIALASLGVSAARVLAERLVPGAFPSAPSGAALLAFALLAIPLVLVALRSRRAFTT